MRFLLWLAGAETTPNEVLTAIQNLSPDVEFTWSFSEIRPLVGQLPEPKKTQAECFIKFFEEHHDMGRLENYLMRVVN